MLFACVTLRVGFRQNICYVFNIRIRMQTYWIYQFQEGLTVGQWDVIARELESILMDWKSHGTALSAGWEKYEDRFLMIHLLPDSHAASGCSIDSLNRKVQSLFASQGVGVADAGTVFFLQSGRYMPIRFLDIESAIASGDVDADTLMFEATRTDAVHIEDFIRPAGATWVSRYFAKVG